MVNDPKVTYTCDGGSPIQSRFSKIKALLVQLIRLFDEMDSMDTILDVQELERLKANEIQR
jgi:hypothetical protein